MRKASSQGLPWLQFPANSQAFWFHCSSGEFEYAKPVIRELKNAHPKSKVIVTFFSPSVAKAAASDPLVDFACPTPWDTSWHWRQFLDHHKPKALLIARTDLWPMMIHTAKKQNIPRLLFSKTVNKSKMGLFSIFGFSMMRKLNDIFCVTEEDRELLAKKLKGFANIHSAGDTRYDQCLFRLQHGKSLKPLNNFNRPIFVAGSTWIADELWLWDLIKEVGRTVSFVIAPHEPTPEHLKLIQGDLQKRGLKHQLYSETSSWDPDAVLIIDQVGILADLYKWGQFAFIGGSVNRSVHSVMEPLAQGLLVFIGPNHENNREATIFKNQQVNDMTPVQVVRSSDELIRRFTALHSSWSKDHQFNLQLAIKQKAGASKIVLKWIENHLKSREG